MPTWLKLYVSKEPLSKAWVVSIPKKVISKSVRRSRLKRLIRESMRLLGTLPKDGTYWKFVVKRDPPKGIKRQEAEEVIKSLIEKIST